MNECDKNNSHFFPRNVIKRQEIKYAIIVFSTCLQCVNLQSNTWGAKIPRKVKLTWWDLSDLKDTQNTFSKKNDWFADASMIALPKVTEYSFTKIISKEIHYFTDI